MQTPSRGSGGARAGAPAGVPKATGGASVKKSQRQSNPADDAKVLIRTGTRYVLVRRSSKAAVVCVFNSIAQLYSNPHWYQNVPRLIFYFTSTYTPGRYSYSSGEDNIATAEKGNLQASCPKQR